ncbi:protein of unknown function [Oryzisolibacter propanilivorax]|uniref:DUF4148 domain-containing protein n=1 Tax=Oryzisolibacter propanilivorax TaxID=1527607 RepID=A0A1G9TVX2_9BURK|nr:DUF4148 domain-containing protein [Oryzisolibacter propanilivorax]SDM51879.1 protein of unknown function [Oryzisolibacter propanilivorax]
MTRKFCTLLILAGLTAVPALSQANSIWHDGPGESVRYVPEHWSSTKTRADVLAELDAAKADGTLSLIQRGLPVPVKSTEAPKTRQQVIDELHNESPQARSARAELLRN